MNETVKKQSHHIKQEVCLTRAAYRDGRKPTAVKVYTVHQESKYLLVQGVPDIGASRELVRLFEVYGDIEEHKILENYPTEQFQEVHFIKYKKIQSARYAKKKLDDWSFYGGVLHVCYAPEFESIEETREKLQQRRRIIETKTRQYRNDGTYDLYKSAKSQTAHLEDTDNREKQTHLDTNTISTGACEVGEDDSMIHFVAEQDRSVSEANVSGYVSSAPVGGQVTGIPQTVVDQGLAAVSTETDTGRNNTQFQSVLRQSLGSFPYLNQQAASHVSSAAELTQSRGQHANIRDRKSNVPDHVRLVVEQARAMQYYGITNETTDTPTSDVNSGSCSEEVRPDSEHTMKKGEKSVEHLHNDGIQKSNTVDSKEHDTLSAVVKDREVARVGKALEKSTDQLILPPPPKQRRTGFRLKDAAVNFGHARVASAQAEFPPGFDARLEKPKMPSKDSDSDIPKYASNSRDTFDIQKEKNLDNSGVGSTSSREPNFQAKQITYKRTVPSFIPRQTVQKKEKAAYKGPVPGFIPRQAVKKKAVTEIVVPDNMNKELRKNAFMLGKEQGPGYSRPPDEVHRAEKSVDKTVRNIRKRLREVTSTHSSRKDNI